MRNPQGGFLFMICVTHVYQCFSRWGRGWWPHHKWSDGKNNFCFIFSSISFWWIYFYGCVLREFITWFHSLTYAKNSQRMNVTSISAVEGGSKFNEHRILERFYFSISDFYFSKTICLAVSFENGVLSEMLVEVKFFLQKIDFCRQMHQDDPLSSTSKFIF